MAIIALVAYRTVSLRSDDLTAELLKIQMSWDVQLHFSLCCSGHFKVSWNLHILHPSSFYYIPLYRTDMEQVSNVMQCIKHIVITYINNHED